MKQKSPMLRLWELGEGQQGGLKRAVLSAVGTVWDAPYCRGADHSGPAERGAEYNTT
ncbi:MAG: hypothetical protein ACLVKN_19390 [Flavonifractor plautii]